MTTTRKPYDVLGLAARVIAVLPSLERGVVVANPTRAAAEAGAVHALLVVQLDTDPTPSQPAIDEHHLAHAVALVELTIATLTSDPPAQPTQVAARTGHAEVGWTTEDLTRDVDDVLTALHHAGEGGPESPQPGVTDAAPRNSSTSDRSPAPPQEAAR